MRFPPSGFAAWAPALLAAATANLTSADLHQETRHRSIPDGADRPAPGDDQQSCELRVRDTSEPFAVPPSIAAAAGNKCGARGRDAMTKQGPSAARLSRRAFVKSSTAAGAAL